MRTITRFVLAFAATAQAHAQPANPLTSGARLHYGIIKGYVTRAAMKMPEESQGPSVRRPIALRAHSRARWRCPARSSGLGAAGHGGE